MPYRESVGPRAERALPRDDADELTWLLFHQSDVVAGWQVRRFLTEAALRHRVRTGRWRRAYRGVYIAHNGPVGAEERLWVAVLGCGRDTALAGLTAAARCGLRGFGSAAIQVVRPARLRGGQPPPGVVLLRSGSLSTSDVNRVGAPPHTTNARSLVDAARWAGSDDQARAIIASGFQQKLVGGDDVHEVVYRIHRLPRRSLILAAANDAREGSTSLPELRYLRASRHAGLPEPSRQHRRVDGSGRTRYLDVYYRSWGVHVEIDGSQHLDARAQWADMKRQNDVWISGDRVLRFPAWLVRERPDEVIDQVRAALTAAGWRPS